MSASIPETHRDLADTPGTATLTTIGASGYPQSTAIWFISEGDVIVTSLHRSRQKYKNLLANPRATLFVLDPANPFRTLEVRGDVTLEDDPDLEVLTRVVTHYGLTLDTFPAEKEDRVAVTLTPRRVVANG